MTSDTTGRARRRQFLITLSALALAVAGCHKPKATSAEGTQPMTGAPIAALPLATATPPEMTAAPEAEDGSRLEGEHTHSKLVPCHALDLRAKVNGCK